jgi:AcrR family transcriptional regulator
VVRPRDSTIDQRIIDACVALLNEVGRHRLTRERIARRAGVSLPALVRRFASVEDVLLAVASTPPAEPVNRPGDPPVDSLRTFLLATLTRMVRALAAGGIRRPAVELLAAAAGDERIDEALRASVAELRVEGMGWVEHAKTTGEIRPDVDGDTLLDLIAAAAYYPLLWRATTITEPRVEPIVDLLLSGAAPRR